METKSFTRKKITLYRGFPPDNTYTWSPFVTKLEFRLRHADIKYDCLEGSTSEGPSGKVPYIDLAPLSANSSGEKELVGDSSIIIRTLIEMGAVEDLNSELSDERMMADMAIRGLCEEKLYFLGMAERWLDNYYVHRDKILVTKPWLLRYIIGNLIHRKIVQTVHLQGCGRFSQDEQRTMRLEIWQTIEKALSKSRPTATGKEPFWYFGGDDASEVDAVLYAFINSALVTRSCPDSMQIVKGLPAAMDYAERIHDKYFPDYEKWNA